ncbi:MAG: DNA-3-methyladenine glycosylase I [Actinobacteria bacterium]|nr:DNA-3-methyladenine glycosylase I [Actinomycetota bacterium]
MVAGDDGRRRCWWCGDDPAYVDYHDREWGRPVHDDTRLFEKLVLEGFQSGLAWITILRKREAFRSAFAGFDIATVARFTEADVARLLGDAGIVRHRGKIEAAVANARAAETLIAEEGSLDAFVWRYVPDPAERPRRLTRDVFSELALTPSSTALAKDLKRRGFRFVGPTTAYAFMQSMGVVNDHVEGCHARGWSGPDGAPPAA